MKKCLLWILGPLLLSCSKDTAGPASFPTIENGVMMLVCAEGNFRWNNAEAGLINLRSGEASWKAFSAKNGRPPGDVLQSASFWGGRLWLVLNNSGRLEGLDPATFEVKESINGLTSPRFLQAVSEEKAYCSDLYASKLWILQRGSSKPSGSISMPGWTEEMVYAHNRVWVLCRKKPWVLGIDPQSDQVTDTLFLPGNGSSMATGSFGRLWVSFESGINSAPGLGLFHTDSLNMLQIWNTDPANPAPDRLQASSSGDSLFFLSAGLCRIQTGSSDLYRYSLPSGNWYGLGLDILRKRILVSDVKDYQQESRILQLDFDGATKADWTGGIISSRFYFW